LYQTSASAPASRRSSKNVSMLTPLSERRENLTTWRRWKSDPNRSIGESPDFCRCNLWFLSDRAAGFAGRYPVLTTQGRVDVIAVTIMPGPSSNSRYLNCGRSTDPCGQGNCACVSSPSTEFDVVGGAILRGRPAHEVLGPPHFAFLDARLLDIKKSFPLVSVV